MTLNPNEIEAEIMIRAIISQNTTCGIHDTWKIAKAAYQLGLENRGRRKFGGFVSDFDFPVGGLD